MARSSLDPDLIWVSDFRSNLTFHAGSSMVVLRRREGGDAPQYNEDEEQLEERRLVLQSLNYPEDYDMLSPQAQRAARERAAKEALAGHQIRWVGPLAAQTPPSANAQVSASSSPPGSAQKPRQPIWCG